MSRSLSDNLDNLKMLIDRIDDSLKGRSYR
jgi:hypothetical protein